LCGSGREGECEGERRRNEREEIGKGRKEEVDEEVKER
jgi:hypothetical protein